MSDKNLKITGINENNLKNLSLELPHNELVAITGLSGSGKSSLAFDTVYAEGQRRYIETFSPYVRQFLDKIKKPDLLTCENIRPALAVQQKTKITSSRSTVGSLTNINDYIAILFANLSTPFSKDNIEFKKYTASEVLDDVIIKKEDSLVYITSPVLLPKKKNLLKEYIASLETLGFSRFFIEDDFNILTFEENSKSLSINQKIFILIDRFKFDKINKRQFLDAIDNAYNLSKGVVQIFYPNKKSKFVYSKYYIDQKNPDLDLHIPNPTPALFSFSSSLGACSNCKGFGFILEADESKIVPDSNLSIKDGAIHCWKSDLSEKLQNKLINFCKENDINIKTPWNKLTKEERFVIFFNRSSKYKGIALWLKSLESKTYKTHIRIYLAKYRSSFVCPECEGKRVNSTALYFKLLNRTVADIQELEINELLIWAKDLAKKFRNSLDISQIIKALISRVEYLDNLGLSYLTLSRTAKTLSGGETQRENLASAIGSELTSTQFVLDEPSVGLHPEDTNKLMIAINELKNKSNSVLLVEHDIDCIRQSEHILELGPKSGKDGGNIVFNNKASKWHFESEYIDYNTNAIYTQNNYLEIKNASNRNLKSVSTKIPLNSFATLAGVSGSGKSTLVEEVILKSYENFLKDPANSTIKGFEHIEQVLNVDQSGLVKSPRANIATYSKIWEKIRVLLANTDLAKARMLDKSHFSFNVDKGRCPNCQGAGYIKESMQFLSDVYVLCDVCLGSRFQNSILEIEYNSKNVNDWLKTTVYEVRDELANEKDIYETSQILIKLGLGHLTLGHSLSELSGGEAQRLKLVPFIDKSNKSKSLLIFDEPSAGLHLEDVRNLIKIFRELIAKGHSVLCIEHNLEILLASDWIIELGPQGGKNGGQILMEGFPKDFLNNKISKDSRTAKFLKNYKNSYNDIAQSNLGKKNKNVTRNLEILNAKEHNLKNINVEIKHNEITAIVGVSGSGKSTIAKDIIYSEGQRRYLDCLSPYARQFIKELKRPHIGEIHNLRPTICVYQHTFQPSKLSTIGTMSEVYNYLRLLFTKAGDQYCPTHKDTLVKSQSLNDLVNKIKSFNEHQVKILAPIVKGKKGHHRPVFEKARSLDISEVRVDNVFASVGNFEEGLDRNKTHNIEFVWAKIIPNRIPIDLIESAVSEVMALSAGNIVLNAEGQDFILSTKRGCPSCGEGVFKPDPEDLSFNSKRGKCQTCEGYGLDEKGYICKKCLGSRLNDFGLSVKIDNKNIYELTLLTPKELNEFLIKQKWQKEKVDLVKPLLNEIFSRLDRLANLGLDYLPLSRPCHSISKGELQRLKLATAIGSPMSGALYIFDEPSAGLHPNDNKKVLQEFKNLKNNGNTVLLIEHDEETVKISDNILEIGPKGGSEGGEVTYQGPIGKYKFPKLPVIESEKSKSNEFLEIINASKNNIKNLSCKIPLQQLVCVSGVSGAGKSSLVNGIILETIKTIKKPTNSWSSDFAKIKSSINIDSLKFVDQSPIGKNSRSTPSSYLKIWDEVRKLFALTIEAKSRGWTNSFFSYNSGTGRCSECQGKGEIKLEMSFLADAFVPCHFCNSTRYTQEALSVKYLELNVSEILNLTFSEAKDIFKNHKKIMLVNLGLII